MIDASNVNLKHALSEELKSVEESMMKNKQPNTNTPKKAVYLSSNVYFEDFELLTQVIAEKALLSRKEGLHAIFNGYRGLSDSDTEVTCRYLFGDFCLKQSTATKLKKVDALHCRVCLKAEQLRNEDYAQLVREREEKLRVETEEANKNSQAFELKHKFLDTIAFKTVTFNKDGDAISLPYYESDLWKKALDFIAKKEAEIAELKKPIDGEPLAEKNALLRIELSRSDQEIKRLNAEIEKKEAIIQRYMFQQAKADETCQQNA